MMSANLEVPPARYFSQDVTGHCVPPMQYSTIMQVVTCACSVANTKYRLLQRKPL